MINDKNIILLDSDLITDKSRLENTNVLKTLDSDNLCIKDLYVDNKKYLLVMSDNEKSLKKVKSLNLREFDDYIQYKYYKKKIVILYGNCHMQALFEFLKNNNEFNNKYTLYPIPYIQTIHKAEFFEYPVFRNCDVFIHQAIQLANRYGKEFASSNIIQKLKKDCKVIAVPNVYQLPKFFFPQYRKNNELKTYFPYKGTIFFRDQIIDENIKKGKTINEIIDIYNDKNLFKKYYIKAEYEKFLDKIRMREQEWDIKVSDFIIENINKKQLFFDPNHPTNFFINYIYLELLPKLDIKDKSLNTEPILSLEAYQMPLCASIIDYFILDYDLNNHEIRKHGRKMYKCKMNLKKYIIQYYCYIWQDSSFCLRHRILSFLLHLLYGSFGLATNTFSFVVRRLFILIK